VKWLPFVACYFIPRGRGFFFLFSLSFSSLGASFFGCFQPCWFFQMPLPSFVLSARFMLLGSFFTWVYFLLEPFFESLSSSTSSHHGEERPVIFLSNSISSISSLMAAAQLAKLQQRTHPPFALSGQGGTVWGCFCCCLVLVSQLGQEPGSGNHQEVTR
jgi:hypothetical protein